MSEKVFDFRGDDKHKYEYDVFASELIPDAIVALQQGETPIFSLGDVSTITGMAKSRKTFLITAIIVAFLKDGGFMEMNSDLDEKRVLLIDTEQSRAHVQRLMKRIFRMMGWDFSMEVKDKLRVLSLRELTPDARFKTLTNTIADFRPTLVLVDGSADLIDNTNDLTVSNAMVNELMRLSSQHHCHICSVVHTNPNSEKTRGHFGSELQRKSETVMLVAKEGDLTTVKPQFTRNIEFAPFSFRINEKGLPEQVEMTVKKKEDLRGIYEEIYSYSTFLSYGDLREKLMDVTGRGKTACENRIKTGLEDGLIYKDIDSNYRLYIEEVKENMVLPF